MAPFPVQLHPMNNNTRNEDSAFTMAMFIAVCTNSILMYHDNMFLCKGMICLHMLGVVYMVSRHFGPKQKYVDNLALVTDKQGNSSLKKVDEMYII